MIPHLHIFCSCGLVVDDTVHGEDNLEEKTREDADIRMFYLVLRFEFVHQGRDMLL